MVNIFLVGLKESLYIQNMSYAGAIFRAPCLTCDDSQKKVTLKTFSLIVWVPMASC